jgi:uncharacterized repeat protein (TIGR01451 family)
MLMSLQKRTFATGLMLLLIAVVPLLAEVTVQLTALKVVRNGDKETLVPAEEAKPGEVVEYRAVYKNSDKNPVRDVKATIPVPSGMEYLPGTAQPADPMASVDGVNFARLPLMRKVKTAEGKLVDQPVPYSEYRYLRWTLGELPAGASRTVSARMRLSSTQPTHK